MKALTEAQASGCRMQGRASRGCATYQKVRHANPRNRTTEISASTAIRYTLPFSPPLRGVFDLCTFAAASTASLSPALSLCNFWTLLGYCRIREHVQKQTYSYTVSPPQTGGIATARTVETDPRHTATRWRARWRASMPRKHPSRRRFMPRYPHPKAALLARPWKGPASLALWPRYLR